MDRKEQNEYWLGRWARGETGWHQSEVEPWMVRRFSGIAPTRVLVPLCGKSLDLVWLARQGHDVVGVELSALACDAFFLDQGLTPTIRQIDGFSVYESGPLGGKGSVTLYNGDFFAIRKEWLGRIGAVYDRAALIALPAELRTRYAVALSKLVLAQAQEDRQRMVWLQIVIDRQPHDDAGPPYSVPAQEIFRLYGADFGIGCLSREALDPGEAPGEHSVECVYSLKPRIQSGH